MTFFYTQKAEKSPHSTIYHDISGYIFQNISVEINCGQFCLRCFDKPWASPIQIWTFCLGGVSLMACSWTISTPSPDLGEEKLQNCPLFCTAPAHIVDVFLATKNGCRLVNHSLGVAVQNLHLHLRVPTLHSVSSPRYQRETECSNALDKIMPPKAVRGPTEPTKRSSGAKECRRGPLSNPNTR